jgi:hypothetical protein
MSSSDTRKRHGIPSYAIRIRTWGFGPITGDASLAADASEPGKSTVSAGAKLRSAWRKHPFLLDVLQLVNLVALRAPTKLKEAMKTRGHSLADSHEASDPCAANLQR